MSLKYVFKFKVHSYNFCKSRAKCFYTWLSLPTPKFSLPICRISHIKYVQFKIILIHIFSSGVIFSYGLVTTFLHLLYQFDHSNIFSVNFKYISCCILVITSFHQNFYICFIRVYRYSTICRISIPII